MQREEMALLTFIELGESVSEFADLISVPETYWDLLP